MLCSVEMRVGLRHSDCFAGKTEEERRAAVPREKKMLQVSQPSVQAGSPVVTKPAEKDLIPRVTAKKAVTQPRPDKEQQQQQAREARTRRESVDIITTLMMQEDPQPATLPHRPAPQNAKAMRRSSIVWQDAESPVLVAEINQKGSVESARHQVPTDQASTSQQHTDKLDLDVHEREEHQAHAAASRKHQHSYDMQDTSAHPAPGHRKNRGLPGRGRPVIYSMTSHVSSPEPGSLVGPAPRGAKVLKRKGDMKGLNLKELKENSHMDASAQSHASLVSESFDKSSERIRDTDKQLSPFPRKEAHSEDGAAPVSLHDAGM